MSVEQILHLGVKQRNYTREYYYPCRTFWTKGNVPHSSSCGDIKVASYKGNTL